jgi:hypothetical protein
MRGNGMAKRELPVWVGVAAVVVVLGVAAWFYRGLFMGPPGPDYFNLDARNPENVALFRQMDAHYKKNPGEKPRNWPPPQFTDEAITKAQEQHKKDFADAEQRRAKVIQDYLNQNKRGK